MYIYRFTYIYIYIQVHIYTYHDIRSLSRSWFESRPANEACQTWETGRLEHELENRCPEGQTTVTVAYKTRVTSLIYTWHGGGSFMSNMMRSCETRLIHMWHDSSWLRHESLRRLSLCDTRDIQRGSHVPLRMHNTMHRFTGTNESHGREVCHGSQRVSHVRYAIAPYHTNAPILQEQVKVLGEVCHGPQRVSHVPPATCRHITHHAPIYWTSENVQVRNLPPSPMAESRSPCQYDTSNIMHQCTGASENVELEVCHGP